MKRNRPRFILYFLLTALLWTAVYGCAPVQAGEGDPVIVRTESTPASSPTPSPEPATPAIASTATVTPTPELKVCSPFDDWNRAQLIDAISNPFHPPPLGSDDPHQGVDFSDIDPVYGYAREGLAVHAVLSGRVVGVINDRFPYGNAVVIETALENLPAGLTLPTERPEVTETTTLTCPPAIELDFGETMDSLYLLYAHMQTPVGFTVGDPIECGQPLGNVGGTGNALAPHLHIEARLGAPSQRFTSMAHYDSSASEVEMANYCAWRVSGAFVLVDPMVVISLLP